MFFWFILNVNNENNLFIDKKRATKLEINEINIKSSINFKVTKNKWLIKKPETLESVEEARSKFQGVEGDK